MDQAGSLAFNPSPDDAERERIQELSRYYCTFGRPPRSRSPAITDAVPNENDLQGDEQPSMAALSTDITLTALAQLGVHRLACERSFVSIIDGDNQHIIAEATASVSLRDKDHHLPGDAIYLGARTLGLVWGVCPHTIRLFTGKCGPQVVESDNLTANPTRYIIRDFTKEESFRDRPYVREWPHMRFYAEVPLYSPSGYVLGSFCVVDNKPRTKFDDEDVNILREIADAIAQHLENVRIAHNHRRSERLVQGLTTFVKDYTDFDPRGASSARRLESTARASNENTLSTAIDKERERVVLSSAEGNQPEFGPATSSSAALTEEMTSPNLSESTQPSSLDSISDRQVVTPGEEKSLEATLKFGERDRNEGTAHSTTALSSSADNIPLSDRISSVFSRASSLLKDSMDLDGVVFLDATQSNPSFLPSHEPGSWEPLPKTATADVQIAPFPSPMGSSDVSSTESDTFCDVISSAMKLPGKSEDETEAEFAVPEKLLDMLIVHYPQGQIFRLDKPADSNDYMSYRKVGENPEEKLKIAEKVSRRLRQSLPDARSVLFFPLWDHSKSRWMAGTIVWTRDDHRGFDKEELHYFKVFGSSIVAEVSRIHWTATEKSKFDFISSVSHELRSPLHGILASAELLHTTHLEPIQAEMLRMIETSGLTLLDTTDHLLDFCKINNLTRTRKLRRHARKHASGLVSDFNLGTLVEEVAEILFSGQKAPATAAHPLGKHSTSSIDSQRAHSSDDERSVVVRIEKRHNWGIRSQGGAWRRIVMNLLGNAMKWTRSGFVEISLSQARTTSDPQSRLAHLSVTDTGGGIAPDFLRHRLFSPFTQEDPLAEGVGLGLSIVRQLVASLGGHITVSSELGMGTQVDVHVPVENTIKPIRRPSSLAMARGMPHVPGLKASLVAFNSYPDLKETPTGMLTAEAKRKLSIQSELADVFITQFGWTVSLAESLDKGRGDVAVIEETTLKMASDDLQLSLENLVSNSGFKFFIVLSSKTPIFRHALPPNFVRASQPFGPRKIEKAAEKILKIYEAQLRRENESVSLPLMPLLETALEAESPSATDEATLLTPVVRAEAMPLEHTGTEEASQLNLLDAPLPVPAPASQVEDGTSLDSGLSPPISSVPPSLARSASEPSPIKLAEATSPVSALSEPKAGHVLIVDDNDINLKIMANFMRKIGCSYDMASNGLIALEKYKESTQPYTYVLMDISMPVMDGLVSTSKIRQFEKEQGIKPSCIMAVTGVASETMQQQALTAGINDYLIKPLSLLELRKIMGAA